MNETSVQEKGIQHDELTKHNALDYAKRHYNNQQLFHNEEFEEDFRAIFYVKKLLTRYANGEETSHHLTLNHIITICNLFGPIATVNLLRFHINEKHHTALNSFFLFLSILPPSEKKVKLDLHVLEYLKRKFSNEAPQ